jgi:hypothetical protein
MKPPYLAYLLRIWKTGHKEPGGWHALLEDPHTHQVTGFTSLEDLFYYLRRTAANQSDAAGKPIFRSTNQEEEK